jgi:hypothetical protein
MNIGQTSATVARLVLGQDVFERGGDDCPVWKVRQVISKEPANLKRDEGYRLSTSALALARAMEHEGLGWCVCCAIRGVDEVSGAVVVDPVLTLLVYWHPSSAVDGQSNTLFKFYMTLVMQVPVDKQRLKHYHGVVKGAMEAGQTSCAISCLGYKQSYHIGNGKLACRETRHYLTGGHICLPKLSPQWVIDDKFQPLIEWIETVQGLSWGLRFCPQDESKFLMDVESQLCPWALLVVYW